MKNYIGSIVISITLVLLLCVSCHNTASKKSDDSKQNYRYEKVEHNDRLLSYSFRDSVNYGMKIIFPENQA
ncbi:MAG TPA: hypothetical protein PLP11_09955, partial [Bacteroidales bacterium]|nr:hypothetical protein [Bacteroidales bacterium]